MVYKSNKSNSEVACNAILDGKVIIHSTDTLYGFAADATNDDAISKLNSIKKREKPLSIIVNSIEMLKKYAIVNSKIENKITKIFPGPFTVILKKRNYNLSRLVSLDLDTIGIRIPDNKFILDCVKKIQRPVITTSVNIHGEDPINNLEIIKKKYSNFNIFTDSISKQSKGSTIIDFSSLPHKIIRVGDKLINL